MSSIYRFKHMCISIKFRVAIFLILSLIHTTSLAKNKQSLPQLSDIDLQFIYKTLDIKEVNGKLVDVCEQEVQPDIKLVDLNKDGNSEIFVMLGSSCFGSTGFYLSLLIKDQSNQWQENFGFSAGGYRLLKSVSDSYPDIEIIGPGFCFPVWRWNGTKYAIHKRCER